MPSRKPPACPLRTQFGRNVRRWRHACGFTQEELAEKVGLSTRYTQGIEAGNYFPALPTLTALRQALGVTWDELLRDC